MVLEIDEVLVKADLWARAKDGDVIAKKEIAKSIDYITLYHHAIGIGVDETVVSLRQLEEIDIVAEIKIHCEDKLL